MEWGGWSQSDGFQALHPLYFVSLAGRFGMSFSFVCRASTSRVTAMCFSPLMLGARRDLGCERHAGGFSEHVRRVVGHIILKSSGRIFWLLLPGVFHQKRVRPWA